MLVSVVVPAYKAAATIGNTLRSIVEPHTPLSVDWSVEILVVDDGSPDGAELANALRKYPDVRLLRHQTNQGMCAARNSGIMDSHGDLVIILDADDEFVPDWPKTLAKIEKEWPPSVGVCYAACRNPQGKITAAEPEFSGLLTLSDILNERHTGEYLPLFRGNYIRQLGYVDLGMRKSCGILSYIRFAQDGPFWVSRRVLRIYNDQRTGSVSDDWTSPLKVRETAVCYQELLARFGDLYQTEAPQTFRTKLLRYAIYLKLAGLSGAWKTWLKGTHISCWMESLASLLVIAAGGRIGTWIIRTAKNIGLIRRYG